MYLEVSPLKSQFVTICALVLTLFATSEKAVASTDAYNEGEVMLCTVITTHWDGIRGNITSRHVLATTGVGECFQRTQDALSMLQGVCESRIGHGVFYDDYDSFGELKLLNGRTMHFHFYLTATPLCQIVRVL
jgi:hypothetical protein